MLDNDFCWKEKGEFAELAEGVKVLEGLVEELPLGVCGEVKIIHVFSALVTTGAPRMPVGTTDAEPCLSAA